MLFFGPSPNCVFFLMKLPSFVLFQNHTRFIAFSIVLFALKTASRFGPFWTASNPKYRTLFCNRVLFCLLPSSWMLKNEWMYERCALFDLNLTFFWFSFEKALIIHLYFFTTTLDSLHSALYFAHRKWKAEDLWTWSNFTSACSHAPQCVLLKCYLLPTAMLLNIENRMNGWDINPRSAIVLQSV